MEDGAKHTLVLYNCKVPQTGEVAFSAANARCQANLKVKGESSPLIGQEVPLLLGAPPVFLLTSSRVLNLHVQISRNLEEPSQTRLCF